MEPSKIPGESDECHSNESGWTMYIGSSIDGADHQIDQNDDNDNKSDVNHEADSDDSMTSDASSGPSHHQGNQWGNVEGGYYCGFDEFKHDEHEYDSKNCTEKRDEKTKEKQKNVTKIENEEMIFRQKKTKSSVQIHGDKVRTTLCLGNKK